MVSCRDIITRALQKARVIAAGEEPSASEMESGLDELQNLYEQWGAGGMFGRLEDVTASTDYDASPNQRVTVTDGAVVTIPTVRDEDDELPPFDMAFLEILDPSAQTVTRSIYSDGAWVEISELTLDDEAPLASKGRSGLAACLAMSFAEEFGQQVGPGVARQAASFRTALSLKYGSDAKRTAPDYF